MEFPAVNNLTLFPS